MKTIISIIACLILFSFCYCERESVTSINSDNLTTGSVTFSFKKNNSADGVCKIILALSRTGFATINDTVSVTNENTSMIFISSIPLGTWQLKIDGVDNNNTTLYSGQTEVLIQANQTTQVNLTLRPATGSINITVEWGSNNAGKAADFDGGINYINVSSTPTLNAISDAITIEAWVKPQSQYYNTVVSKGAVNFTMQLVKYLRPGFLFKGLNIDYYGCENYWTRILIYDTVLEGEWTHLACTYSKQNQLITIYINGIIKHQCFADGQIESSDDDLRIGARISDLYPEYFMGSMDEIRIWNVVRTKSEIQNNMSKELNGNETGLIGYWNFNEIINDYIVPDISNNDNDGVITGNIKLIDSYAF